MPRSALSRRRYPHRVTYRKNAEVGGIALPRMVSALEPHDFDYLHPSKLAGDRTDNARSVRHRGGQTQRDANRRRRGGFGSVGLALIKGVESQGLGKEVIGDVAVSHQLRYVKGRRHALEVGNGLGNGGLNRLLVCSCTPSGLRLNWKF